MSNLKKNKMNNRAIIPIECQACHKIIQIGQVVINHHLSYFPEIIIKVHSGCHIKIHGYKPKYPELKPNPAQVRRWYRKKGMKVYDYSLYASYYTFIIFMDCVENGFMTQERIDKINAQNLHKIMTEFYRTG